MWLMDGTTTLPGTGPLPRVPNVNMAVVGTGDFDGDGRCDILWRHQVSGKNSMWLMDGTTILPGSGPLPKVADTNWAVVGTGDFDGDGRCDILWRHQINGSNSMWLMDGTTMLPASGLLPEVADTNWAVVGTRDFDGDGRCDILWRHQVTGKNSIWLMDGTSTLPGTGPLPKVRNTNMKVVGTGDFDGDGRCDIVWRHQIKGDPNWTVVATSE
jgi:translation initiation factor IF-1